jgi:MFS family permease
MTRCGLRKIVLWALALLAFAVAFSSTMLHQWELMLFWGILVGTGTGVTALVLAAVVVNRWFEERRGLVLGLLTAANATGQLVFLPLLAKLVTAHGWRSAVYFVAGIAGLVFLVVLFWMKDSPSDVGQLAKRSSSARFLDGARRPTCAVTGTCLVREIPRVLDSRWIFLRLRRQHQRTDRHAPHSGLQ